MAKDLHGTLVTGLLASLRKHVDYQPGPQVPSERGNLRIQSLTTWWHREQSSSVSNIYLCLDPAVSSGAMAYRDTKKACGFPKLVIVVAQRSVREYEAQSTNQVSKGDMFPVNVFGLRLTA